MNRYLLAVVGLVASSAAALCADLPVRVARAAPDAPVAVMSWTGSYIGVGLGLRTLDADWTTTATFSPPGGPIPPSTDPNASLSDTAFRASLYAGYNWQMSPAWLIGLEADIGWAKNKTAEGSRIPGLGVVGGGSFAGVEGTWDASVRARLGVLLTPTWLVYGTGGVALQRLEASVTCPADTTVCNPAAGTQSFSKSETRTGWTVGAGMEVMLMANMIGRLEYRYSDFGDFPFRAIAPSSTTFGADAKVSTTTHLVTVGVAWKL